MSSLRLPDTLSAVQERAVEDLRRDGVSIVPFVELLGEERWQELVDDIAGFIDGTEAMLPAMSREQREAEFGKAFLVRRHRRKDKSARASLSPSDPWLRYGASPEMLGIVNTYRGVPVRLHDYDNWYTVPDPDAPARVASQRWHRDGWENHIVKVFTYFNDVDEEAGPFEYVKSSAAGGKYGDLWPWQDKEVYPDQDELAEQLDAEDCVALTGPAGSIVFCDTSGFHRGGFARTRPRILSYHTFLSDEGSARHKRKFDVDWSDDGAGLAPESQYALS